MAAKPKKELFTKKTKERLKLQRKTDERKALATQFHS